MSTNPRIPFQLSTERPKYAPPQGKPLIVQIVVNVENWRFDQPMPRKLLTAPHGAELMPDVPNFSWAEYGMRCGLPRLLGTLTERGLPVGASINAGVIHTYPRAAQAMLEAGWEFIGHGLHQQSLQSEPSEEELIGESLARLTAFTGQRVEGWLGPGLKQSHQTLDVLKAQGVRYCLDWVLDDLPVWARTDSGPILAVPYSLEINDSVCHAVQSCPSDELLRRLEYTLETLTPELADNPRVLSIGLHPHLMGVPHRFPFVLKMLDLLMAHDDAIFMTGRQIADWFERVSPAPTREGLKVEATL